MIHEGLEVYQRGMKIPDLLAYFFNFFKRNETIMHKASKIQLR